MKRKGAIGLIIVLILSVGGYFAYNHFFKEEAMPVVANVSEEKKVVETYETSPDDNFPIHYDIPVDKEWVISFDEELAADTVNGNSVYVLDKDGNKVGVEVSLTDENHSVSVKPASGGYTKGEYYELFMEDTIGYTDGDTVSKTFKMGYFIARDEVLDIVMNKEIITFDETAIVSDSDNILVIDKKQVKEDLVVGDILKVPTDHEVFEEKAIKVLAVSEKRKEVIVQYEQPKFTELFEKFDMYKNIDLTGNGVIFVPAEGVEMNEIASVPTNRMIAASSSAKKQEEFDVKPANTPQVGIEVNKGIEFSIKGVDIKIGKHKAKMNGKLKLHKPTTTWDIDLGFLKVNRLNAQMSYSRTSELETTFKLDKFQKLAKKKFSNDIWQASKEIPLGTMYVPVFPGVFVEGNLSAVYGVNLLSGKGTFDLIVTAKSEETTKVGIIKNKKGYKPVFDYDPKLDVNMQVKGSADAKVTGELQAGITALEVLGLGLEAEGGGYGSGEGIAGTNTKSPFVCFKGDTGFLLGGGIVLDALLIDEVASLKIQEFKFPQNQVNTCQEYKGLSVSPEKIEAKPGQTIELKVNGKYLDKITGKESEKTLLNKLSDLNINTSNENIASLLIRKSKEPVVGGETTPEGVNIKLRTDKNYKLLVKIPKEPEDEKATITIEYKNEKIEVPVHIEGVAKPLPENELKEIVGNLLGGIHTTYRDLGKQYGWIQNHNPPDFNILRPALLNHATPSLTDGTLKDIKDDMYCECDSFLFPNPEFNIRFKVHENTGKKAVVSSIEFANELNGGKMTKYTVVKQNGKWLMDKLEYIDTEKEGMNVTRAELDAYHKTLGTDYGVIINEVTHNGKKVFVVDYGIMGIRGVYSYNTDFIYDIPDDWLPEGYKTEEEEIVEEAEETSSAGGSVLDGDWTSDLGQKLTISNSSETQFDFYLFVSNDRHAGEIQGTAFINGPSATFSESDYGCSLIFEFQEGAIQVTEGAECIAWHGVSVDFQDIYKR